MIRQFVLLNLSFCGNTINVVQTPVERIVSILRGNGQTDAQNAETARRILAALEVPEVEDEPSRHLVAA